MMIRNLLLTLVLSISATCLQAQSILFAPATQPLVTGTLSNQPNGFVVVSPAPGLVLSIQPDGSVETRSANAIAGWELAIRVGSNLLKFSGAGTDRFLFMQALQTVVDPGSVFVPSPASGATSVTLTGTILPLTPGLSFHDQFLAWVADKPFGQATLRWLEPTLLAHGWRLENPNHDGDITKLYTPDGNNYRVGFGEGHWVWIPWSGNH